MHLSVVGVLWLWAAAIIGLAWARGTGLDHGLMEALPPIGFGVAALWSWPDAWQRIGLATAGLGVAHAITLHLVEGAVWAHLLFLALVLPLMAYRHPAVPWFLVADVVLVHVGVASVDPHSVYGHGWPVRDRLSLIATEILWVIGAAWSFRRLRVGPRKARESVDGSR